MGHAVPHKIGRHVHAKARPDEATPPPTPTGINYLGLVEQQHKAELAGRLRYSDLPDGHVPGQLQLPGTSGNTTEDNNDHDNNDDSEVSA